MNKPHLCQSDPKWKDSLLWFSSSSSIGAKGCGLTGAAQLQREFGIRLDATPLTAQADAIARFRALGGNASLLPAIRLPVTHPFQPGVNIVWATAFDSLGMRISPCVDQSAGLKAMRGAILGALLTGGRAMLNVDHDEHRKGGDPEGDHYVTALRLDVDRIVYADPADGAEWSLPVGTLTGPATWGSRTFAVRGVRAVVRKQ